MESIPTAETGKHKFISQTFYTLRYRDFRLFWIALTISLLGLSFQTVAQGWLVYRLTGSATMLGLAGFIPAVFAAPASLAGGVIADRFSRRNLVIVTQSLMILPPIILSYLIWSEKVQPWHVIASTTVLAIIAAVDLPSRTAMVPQLVPQDDLLNAQGLASAMGQLTRIIGPALAGVVIALWGEAVPFLINGLSYLAMVIAFLMINPQPALVRDRTSNQRTGLLSGVRFALKTSLVLGLLLIVAAQGLFLNSYVTLLPVFASDILHAGPAGLGWMNAAVGVGALIGALGIANLKKGRRGQILNITSFIVPLVLAFFAWSGWFAQALPLLFLLGLGIVIIRTITGTFLLVAVPDQLLGRVLSFATLIWYGAPYAAALPIGYLAEHWSVPAVLSLTGFLFLITMILINFKFPTIRQQE